MGGGWGHLEEKGASMWCLKCGKKHSFGYGYQGNMKDCYEHLCGGELVPSSRLPDVVAALRKRLKKEATT